MPQPGTRAPLLWLVVPLAAGIAASAFAAPLPATLLWYLAAAAGLALLSAWVGRRESTAALIVWAGLLGLAAGLVGFAWAHLRSPRLEGWDGRPPRELQVELRVRRVFSSAPGARMRQGLGIIVAAPAHAAELRGLQVYFSTIRRADVVAPQPRGTYLVTGVVVPFTPGRQRDGFNDYLQNLGVAAKLQRGHVVAEREAPGPLHRFATRARHQFAAMLKRGLEHRPSLASLQVAMMLGEKAALDPAQEAAFMRSGTYHIFSVSGLHVGAIATAIQGLLLIVRAPRPVRVAAGLAILWFYVLVVGANPPAVRAFIMVAFLLARGLWGLPGNTVAALAAAALTTLLLDPRQLFGSGFQLSYTVVGALVLMGVPLSERWRAAWRPWGDLPEVSWRRWQKAWRWLGRLLLNSVAITWAAVVGSTPATIAAFGLFTPGALVANLAIVPLASGALAAGFLSILGGCLGLGGVSILFNHAAALIILVMDQLARWSTAVPYTHFPAAYRAAWLEGPATAVPLALMLAGAALGWRGAGGFWLPAAGLAALLLACVRLG